VHVRHWHGADDEKRWAVSEGGGRMDVEIGGEEHQARLVRILGNKSHRHSRQYLLRGIEQNYPGIQYIARHTLPVYGFKKE